VRKLKGHDFTHDYLLQLFKPRLTYSRESARTSYHAKPAGCHDISGEARHVQRISVVLDLQEALNISGEARHVQRISVVLDLQEALNTHSAVPQGVGIAASP
jgi:hypothetical protein